METSETIENLPHDRFNSRVDDWLDRINHLYEEMEIWIQDYKDFEYRKNREFSMHEELMRIHGISAKIIDIFDVYKKEDLILSFVPFGLWVLGSNGRIDLVSNNKSWFLIDKSLPLKPPPEWTLVSRSSKNLELEFNQENLHNLLLSI